MADRGELIAETQRAYSSLVRRARLSLVQRRVAAEAGVDLDRGGYVVLNRLADWGPVRLSQLADLLMVDMSTVSRHVARLEGAGLLERTLDPDDRRARVLAITDNGRASVDRMTEAWRAVLAEVLEDWEDDEVGQLAHLLEQFADDFLKLVR